MRGGIAASAERLAYALQDAGCEVVIYSFSLQYPDFLFPGKSQFTDDPAPAGLTIKTRLNAVNPFNWLIVGREIAREDADQIIVRFWLPFMGPCLGTVLRVARRMAHKKLHITALVDNIVPHEKRPGDRPFARYFVRACDDFVVMSKSVGEEIRGFLPGNPTPDPSPEGRGDTLPAGKGEELNRDRTDVSPEGREGTLPESKGEELNRDRTDASPEGREDTLPESKGEELNRDRADVSPEGREGTLPEGKGEELNNDRTDVSPEGRGDTLPEGKGEELNNDKMDVPPEAAHATSPLPSGEGSGVGLRIRYAPHPVYDSYGQPADQTEARRRLGLPEQVPLVLFFGLIRKYKGLDLLLAALAQATDIHAVIAGECYEPWEDYQNIISANNLGDRVHLFTDFIPAEQVRFFFSAADLVVQPYRSATQSGISQIAYHFEKPMVVTNVGGLPEIVTDGVSGYVVAPEPGAIAAAMRDFFENNRAAGMQAGVREEKKRFSWENLVEKLL